MRATLLIISLLVMTACDSRPTSQQQGAAQEWVVPSSRQACEKAGGEWANYGMPGDPGAGPSCQITAPDSGKACSSSEQCMSGACEPVAAADYGDKVAGACAASQRVNGCMRVLRDGVVVSQPCAM